VIDLSDVMAVIPTRGDHDLSPILDDLIFDYAVWDNSALHDMGAFSRYWAIGQVGTPYIYTQDDDCLVSPDVQRALVREYEDGGPMLSNMNPDHNAGMPLLALPGWGAIFATDEPQEAFTRWFHHYPEDAGTDDFLRIGCDIIFPVLTDSRMLDLGHVDMPWAWDENRTHLQPGYHRKKLDYYHRAATLRAVLDHAT
jgi:hypothetical protein